MKRLKRKLFYSSNVYLYLLPSLVFLVIFTYYPIIRALQLSFFRWNITTPNKVFVWFSNYLQIIHTPLFWRVIENNIIYSFATIFSGMGLGLLLALLVNQRLRLNTFYRTAFFYPTIVPTVAAAMVWLWIFNPGYGLLNYYLGRINIYGIEWLNDKKWALTAIILIGIWKNVGYQMILFLAGLQNIPENLYEASVIEGANTWHKFWRITFPLLGPTTLFVFIMSMIESFQQVFDQVYVLTQGGPGDSTNVLVYYIYQNAFKYWDMGIGSTLTTVFILILLVLVLLIFRCLGGRIFYR